MIILYMLLFYIQGGQSKMKQSPFGHLTTLLSKFKIHNAFAKRTIIIQLFSENQKNANRTAQLFSDQHENGHVKN